MEKDKNKQKLKSRYEFYLDMSGTLKKSTDDIYIGAILISDLYKSAFREKFYIQFPSLKSFNKKGSSLPPEKLKTIIDHISKSNVKMCCIVLKRHLINEIKKDIINKISISKKIPINHVNIRYFEEKVVASVYVEALKKHAFKGYYYNCLSCPETQFDIQQTFVAIDRICYSMGLHFRFSSIPRRTEHMIKFADLVASAGRKLDKITFEKFKYFEFVEYIPDYRQLDRAFGISKHAKSKSSSQKISTKIEDEL